MANIAILSANPRLARFYELELLSGSYSVNVFTDASDIYGYDAVFWDIDTIHNYRAEGEAVVVKISKTFEGISAEEPFRLPWPTDIRDIRKLCTGIFTGALPTNKEDSTKLYDKIYVVDRKSFTVMLAKTQIKLSKSEFAILEALCSASGKTVTRREIMKILDAEDGNISDVYICHLRKKLELPSGKRLIFTERGQGYKTFLKML